jgi:hypothetical protein
MYPVCGAAAAGCSTVLLLLLLMLLLLWSALAPAVAAGALQEASGAAAVDAVPLLDPAGVLLPAWTPGGCC